VRDALATEVAVVIDDRDQIALADQEGDEADSLDDPAVTEVERIRVTKRVSTVITTTSVQIFYSPSIPRSESAQSIITKARKRK
jgi:hypothetical protein